MAFTEVSFEEQGKSWKQFMSLFLILPNCSNWKTHKKISAQQKKFWWFS